MIGFLFSPFGRVAVLVVVILGAIGAVYLKGYRDARTSQQLEQAEDAARRTNDAIRAGDRAVDPARLREPDPYRRD